MNKNIIIFVIIIVVIGVFVWQFWPKEKPISVELIEEKLEIEFIEEKLKYDLAPEFTFIEVGGKLAYAAEEGGQW